MATPVAGRTRSGTDLSQRLDRVVCCGSIAFGVHPEKRETEWTHRVRTSLHYCPTLRTGGYHIHEIDGLDISERYSTNCHFQTGGSMKRPMFKVAGLILIAAFLITVQSCSKKSNPAGPTGPTVPTGTTKKGPGRFAVSLMNGLSKTSEIAASDTTSFDLGDLRHSEYFYFLLSNDGQTPITNISLSTDDSMFQVSPQTITQLGPAGSGSSSIQPVIRIAAIHGTALEGGIGFNPLMPMGINKCVLHIVGQTTSGDTSIDVSLDVALQVNALVANFDLYNGSVKLDPANGGWAIPSPDGNSMRALFLQSDTLIQINTGNVPLLIHGFIQFSLPPTPMPAWDTTIAPGNSVLFQVPDSSLKSGAEFLMSVYDENTITDQSKWRADVDGNIYILFHEGGSPTPPDTDSTATKLQVKPFGYLEK